MLLSNLNLLATAPGGVARLRELILTLAVQGKLVPQDPKDEPASELLKKIRAKKGRLIAEGKIKRDKTALDITEQETPFELPDSWCWVQLGDVTNYGSPSKAGAIRPETWVLDMEDIEKSSGRLVQRLRFAERPVLSDKNCFSEGDVLYGKLRPYLNKVLVADEDGVCTTEIIPFRCYGDYVPGYFRLALSSPFFLDYVNVRSYGMKMPRLGTDDARKAVIPLPPIAEQSRIVTRVEELMRLCDALEAKGQLEATQHAQLVSTLLATLADSEAPAQLTDNWRRIATHFDLLLDRPEAVDVLEQTILQLAVRGILVPQDPQDEPASALLKKIRAEKDKLIADGKIKRDKPLPPINAEEKKFALPHGWEWVQWGDLTKWMTYGFTRPMPHHIDGIPILTAKNVQYGFLDFENVHFTPVDSFMALSQKDRPRKGDILITKDGSIGRAAHVKMDTPFCINQSVAVLWTAGLPINQDYLILVAHSPSMQRRIWASAEGAAIKHISITEFVQFALALPPLAEQSRIVTRVAQLRRLCADLRQRLSASQSTQAHLAEALVQDVA